MAVAIGAISLSRASGLFENQLQALAILEGEWDRRRVDKEWDR